MILHDLYLHPSRHGYTLHAEECGHPPQPFRSAGRVMSVKASNAVTAVAELYHLTTPYGPERIQIADCAAWLPLTADDDASPERMEAALTASAAVDIWLMTVRTTGRAQEKTRALGRNATEATMPWMPSSEEMHRQAATVRTAALWQRCVRGVDHAPTSDGPPEAHRRIVAQTELVIRDRLDDNQDPVTALGAMPSAMQEARRDGERKFLASARTCLASVYAHRTLHPAPVRITP